MEAIVLIIAVTALVLSVKNYGKPAKARRQGNEASPLRSHQNSALIADAADADIWEAPDLKRVKATIKIRYVDIQGQTTVRIVDVTHFGQGAHGWLFAPRRPPQTPPVVAGSKSPS